MEGRKQSQQQTAAVCVENATIRGCAPACNSCTPACTANPCAASSSYLPCRLSPKPKTFFQGAKPTSKVVHKLCKQRRCPGPQRRAARQARRHRRDRRSAAPLHLRLCHHCGCAQVSSQPGELGLPGATENEEVGAQAPQRLLQRPHSPHQACSAAQRRSGQTEVERQAAEGGHGTAHYLSQSWRLVCSRASAGRLPRGACTPPAMPPGVDSRWVQRAGSKQKTGRSGAPASSASARPGWSSSRKSCLNQSITGPPLAAAAALVAAAAAVPGCTPASRIRCTAAQKRGALERAQPRRKSVRAAGPHTCRRRLQGRLRWARQRRRPHRHGPAPSLLLL